MRCAVLLLACFALIVRSQPPCDTSANNATNSMNPQCSYAAPYCLGGGCYSCSAYDADSDISDRCDCPSGKGCLKDFNQATFTTCGTLPKYGQSCSTSSDCVTTYDGGFSPTNLVCVLSRCRMCDPATQGNTSFVCPSGVPRQGATLTCVVPGVWGTPPPTTAPPVSTAQGSTTSNTSPPSTTSSAKTIGWSARWYDAFGENFLRPQKCLTSS